VQALVMVWRARDGAGLDTVLRNPSPVVTRMLKLTGLGPVLAVEHTTADEPDQAR
jgi:anti-anti-sigma regulatory factor